MLSSWPGMLGSVMMSLNPILYCVVFCTPALGWLCAAWLLLCVVRWLRQLQTWGHHLWADLSERLRRGREEDERCIPSLLTLHPRCPTVLVCFKDAREFHLSFSTMKGSLWQNNLLFWLYARTVKKKEKEVHYEHCSFWHTSVCGLSADEDKFDTTVYNIGQLNNDNKVLALVC